MATKIEWTDETWNPTTGCTKKSAGCKNCYAERLAPKVFAGQTVLVKDGVERPRVFTDVRTHEDRLAIPLSWEKPRRVFVDSMSDLFHEAIPDKFIAEVFGVMAVCGAQDPTYHNDDGKFGRRWSQTRKHFYGGKGPHTFQVLTKRPERMQALLTSPAFRTLIASAAYRWAHNQRDAGYLAHQIDSKTEYGRCYPPGRMWPLSNVWLGVSAEDQETADERIPRLLCTPAAVRFLSCEPLLGLIDFVSCSQAWSKRGYEPWRNAPILTGIKWLIAGGESGPDARPPHPEWFRSLRDQCKEAGVKFFFKQWGEWAPASIARKHDAWTEDDVLVKLDGTAHTVTRDDRERYDASDVPMLKIGKHAAGKTLDGRIHMEFPA